MHRGERADVVKGEGIVVLVHLVAGDFAAEDLGEDVGVVVGQCACPLILCSAALPRRFLGQAGDTLSLRQLRPHVTRLDAGRRPQHQQMIEQVGALRRQFLATLGQRGDHHLDGLFAGLLGDPGAALGEQSRGIGCARVGAAPAFDDVEQLLQNPAVETVAVHPVHPPPSSRTGTPAARMRVFASAIVYTPKWKIEAARTAEACPAMIPSTRWSSVPTPPDAITGTRHGVGDRAGQRNVETLLRAVPIHRREEDFAGPVVGHRASPTRPRRCRSAAVRRG